MFKQSAIAAGIFFSAFGWVSAQEQKYEVIPYLGYTTSNGVPIRNTEIGEGIVANKLTPSSGFSLGVNFNVFITEHFSVGFNFAEQGSQLEVGTNSGEARNFNDMKLDNYHGIFSYNFGDEEEQIRPYVFGGLGATRYRFSPFEGQSIDSNTRFSTTWGGGFKAYFSRHVGVVGQFRWTPTYIRSDPGGIWCSPAYPWACWVVPSDHYSHQADFTGGVVFRF